MPKVIPTHCLCKSFGKERADICLMHKRVARRVIYQWRNARRRLASKSVD